ncbi:MAG: hypothetical protein KatS3mg109_0339 [Pirellulaceae bacterium]|nr:MAG: hypothetical protein KatS3mg109_0339 [Pirellulaceae bacterium]
MARESQKMQVAVIVLGMLCVVLVVTTFLGWRSANELTKRADDARKRADAAEQAQRQAASQLQFLMFMVGASNQSLDALKQAGLQMTPELQKVEDQFRQDMAQFGEGLPAEQQNYHTVCANLVAALQQKNEALANADNRIKQTLQELNTKVAELTQRAQAAEAARQQAEQTLLQEVQKFNADRQKYLQQAQADAQKINDMAQQVAQLQADFQTREKQLLDRIEQQQNSIARLREELSNLRKESFERPDGQIVTVNQIERYVWINLGLADGLRPQTIFGVFDQNVTNVRHATPKASIEVTRVLDQHLAEARIVDDNARNPILRNDFIYSPSWQVGSKVRFALAGFMDVNRDGVSDRELIRNLILANNGQIDAEVTDTGELIGKVEVGIRFLVLGREPTERDTPEMLKNFSQLRESCQDIGVQLLSVEDLLNLFGWKPSVQTVKLGSDTAPGAFQPRQPPPRGANGGAY